MLSVPPETPPLAWIQVALIVFAVSTVVIAAVPMNVPSVNREFHLLLLTN